MMFVQVTLAPAGEQVPCLCWWHLSCGATDTETAAPAPAPASLADGTGGTGLDGPALRNDPTAPCALSRFELPVKENQYCLGKLVFL